MEVYILLTSNESKVDGVSARSTLGTLEVTEMEVYSLYHDMHPRHFNLGSDGA